MFVRFSVGVILSMGSFKRGGFRCLEFYDSGLGILSGRVVFVVVVVRDCLVRILLYFRITLFVYIYISRFIFRRLFLEFLRVNCWVGFGGFYVVFLSRRG